MKILKPRKQAVVQTDVEGISADQAFISHVSWTAIQAVAASATGVHAAITASGTDPVVTTTAFTAPPCPRNITATAGGTAGSIKAVSVIVEGTNFSDQVITETLPAFTVDTAGIVTGSKAFKTVTKVTIPAMDGAGATVAIGFGDKLGLPHRSPMNTVLFASLDGVREATPPTVAASATAIESNTIDLDSALNGKVVEAYLVV